MKSGKDGCFGINLLWCAMSRYLCILLFCLLTAAAGFAQANKSLWDNNGSIVRLESNGTSEKFFYEKPKPEVRDEGVTRGTLLFDGNVSGNDLRGTAFVHSRHCGAVGFQVIGSGNSQQVVLAGSGPLLDASCKLVRYYLSVMIFKRKAPVEQHNTESQAQGDHELPRVTSPKGQENSGTASALAIPQWQTSANDDSVVVCLLPVPVAIKNLIELSRYRGAEGQDAIRNDINFLLARYCRSVVNPNLQGEIVNEITKLNDYCWQHSAMLNGGRVYWMTCRAREE